jgi:spermidine/putrescine transport system permease protein
MGTIFQSAIPWTNRLSAKSMSVPKLGRHWLLWPGSLLWILLFAAPLLIFASYGFFRTGVLEIDYVLSLDAYRRALTDPLYLHVVATTLAIATVVAIAVTAISFAFAYYATFELVRWRRLLQTAVVIALFSGYLVRMYAWRTILGSEGVINSSLMAVGLIKQPLTVLLYSRTGVMLVLFSMLLPFSISPLLAAFSNVPRELLHAGRDLGGGAVESVRTVLLPIAHKGVLTAFAFAFVLSAGDYVTAQLIGGAGNQMVGNVIADQFGASFDWPLASALGVITAASAGAVIWITSIVLARVGR